jgi:hypothetical protein
MQLRQPAWELLTPCPVCDQPALVLIACPGCGAVALRCAEEGSAFPSSTALSADDAVPDETVCAACGRVPLSEFVNATAPQILAAGVAKGEYR